MRQASMDLTERLHRNLKRNLADRGSTLWRMTWRRLATPSGRLVYRLVPLARRTSDSDSSSWPTPQAFDATDCASGDLAARKAKGGCSNLREHAMLASWPTPNTPSGGRSMSIEKMDATGRTLDGRKHTASLEHAVKFAPWQTPTREDHHAVGSIEMAHIENWKPGLSPPEHIQRDPKKRGSAGLELSKQAVLASWATHTASEKVRSGAFADGRNLTAKEALGQTSSGSPAETEKLGQLNPAFSLWLQGYPAEWVSCGARATASCRKSPRK